MSLLAGLKFVKKAPTESVIASTNGTDGDLSSGKRGDDGDIHSGEKRKSGSSKKHHKKDKKDRDKGGRKGISEAEPVSKRDKSRDTESNPTTSGGRGAGDTGDGTDWLEQAFTFDGGTEKDQADGESATAEEAAERKRQEEVDQEVVEGKRDPKTKRRYGLYDPLKGDAEVSPPLVGAGGVSGGGGGGLRERSPRVTTGVGDKGAGWRAKALKRAREKAEKSGESLEDLVGERWGSLEQLKHDARGASLGGRGGRGRGRGYGYRRGREELASFAASEGRINPDDSGGLIGQVGRGGQSERGGRDRERGGRGSRLRIGRDAKDTDVLKRFSSKLEDALGRTDETKRSHEDGLPDPHPSSQDNEGRRRSDAYNDRGDDTRGRERRKIDGDHRGDWHEKNLRDGTPDEGSRDRRGKSDGDRENNRGSSSGGGVLGNRSEKRSSGVAGGVDGGWREREARRDEEKRSASDDHRYGLGHGKNGEERPGREGRRSRDDSRDRKEMSADGSNRRHGRRRSREAEHQSHETIDNPAGRETGDVDTGADWAGIRREGDRRSRHRDNHARAHRRADSSDGRGVPAADTARARARDDTDVSRHSRDTPRRDGRDSNRKEGKTSVERVVREDGRRIVDKSGDGETQHGHSVAEAKKDALPHEGENVPSTGAERRSGAGFDGEIAKSEMSSQKGTGEEKESVPTKNAVRPMTEAELTKLAVAKMKAKLKGDKVLLARLIEEERVGREAIAAAAAAATEAASKMPSVRWRPGQDLDEDYTDVGRSEGVEGKGGKDISDNRLDSEKEEVEVVTSFDDKGRPMRTGVAPLMREDLKSGARKGKLKKVGGRWAEHGDESVADFVRREREQGFEDMDETFLRNVSRLGNKFRGTELGGMHTGLAGEDEEEEVDMRMFQRPEDRMTAVAAAERQKSKAIAEHRRQSQATSRCHLCMDAPGFKKKLVLSLGEHTFLYLATGTRKLSEGHCYIVPIRHTPASTACDEDVWREIDLFKSCLRRMAAEPGSAIPTGAATSDDDKNSRQSRRNAKKARRGGGGVIFLETGGKPGSSAARHTFIEAVPVHKDAFLDAPMYFRQALLDAGDEWSTHKKCISADPRRGGVRRAVPKGFPYFHVEWEDGGYAHIIEGEEAKFPRDFGVDTLAGVLGVDPPSFGSRGRGRGGVGAGGGKTDEERKMVMTFLDKWKPFDWTSELDGGEYKESDAPRTT